MGVGRQRLDFAEFYRVAKDECLFSVLVSVGRPAPPCPPVHSWRSVLVPYSSRPVQRSHR